MTAALAGGLAIAAILVIAAYADDRDARRTPATRPTPAPPAPPVPPTAPLDVQPRGAQTGRHRAELIEHDTCPISTADVRRAELARGATR